MYQPWDIDRFRAAIDAGVRDLFEDRPFHGVRVEPAGQASTATVLEGEDHRALVGPTHVFGVPENPGCLNAVGNYPLSCPPKVLYRVPNGRLIGTTSVVDDHGRLYWPDLVVTDADLDRAVAYNLDNSHACVVRREADAAMAYFFWGGAERRIEGTGWFLPNPEPGNYGSFLFRVMPQLLLAARQRLAYDFIIAADRSAWLYDAIRMVGLPVKPIVLMHEMLGDVASNLVFFGDFCVEGFFPQSTVADAHALAGKLYPGGAMSDMPSRLYVSRALSRRRVPQYRPLRNEPDIERRAQRLGFSVVYPEVLPFGHQIQMFARADRVFGPSGSGMLNALFTPAGARVLDMESFTVAVRQHAKVYSSTGKIYSFAFGRFDPTDDRDPTTRAWHMDLSVVDAALEWLMSA